METKNYDLFDFMPSNRKLDQGLVKRLIESISNIGYIKSRPILVNESMIIIDGQHRFEACKKMQLPIFYEIQNIENMHEAMIELNKNQLIWRLEDYVESWASTGILCYKELVLFESKYKLGMSNIISVCCKRNSADISKKIRRGIEFELNEKRYDIVDFIFACKPHLPFWKKLNFVRSIVILYNRGNKIDIEKLLKYITSIQEQPSVNYYLSSFENTINRYKKSSDKISLR